MKTVLALELRDPFLMAEKTLYPDIRKGQSYIYVDNEVDDLYDMGTNFGNWSIKLVTEKADSAFMQKIIKIVQILEVFNGRDVL